VTRLASLSCSPFKAFNFLLGNQARPLKLQLCVGSIMRKYSIIFICTLFLQIALIGCAHLGSPVKKLSIDDIKGAWEHIHFGYIYLYIDDSEEGFLIPGFGENEDIFKIKSITFDGSFAKQRG
jgi:hypothetical protein